MIDSQSLDVSILIYIPLSKALDIYTIFIEEYIPHSQNTKPFFRRIYYFRFVHDRSVTSGHTYIRNLTQQLAELLNTVRKIVQKKGRDSRSHVGFLLP